MRPGLFGDRIGGDVLFGDRTGGDVVFRDRSSADVLFGDRAGGDVLFRERAGGDVVVGAGSAEVAGGAARGQLEGFDPLGHHVHHGAGSLHPAPDHHGTS